MVIYKNTKLFRKFMKTFPCWNITKISTEHGFCLKKKYRAEIHLFFPHLWQFIALAFSTTTSVGPVDWRNRGSWRLPTPSFFLGAQRSCIQKGGETHLNPINSCRGAEQKTHRFPAHIESILRRFRRYALPHFLKPWTIFKCGGCWKGLQFFLQVHTQYECIMTILLLHPGSSTARPWRMVVGRRSFPYFAGVMLNFMSASNFQTIFAANFVAEPCR